MPKNAQTTSQCSNYLTNISHTGKIMLKILQARLQQYVNRELPDVQAGFRKGRGTRGQIANICWIVKKASEFQKNIYFCFSDYAKAYDCVDHNKLWKIPWMEEPGRLQSMGLQRVGHNWATSLSSFLSFFGIRMKTDFFQSCDHCWVFQICWHIKCLI